jgi:hypothetical protein
LNDYHSVKLINALERVAAALEERLPPVSDANKIEALQAQVDMLTRELKLATSELSVLRQQNAVYGQRDLGVACRECGKPILGIGAVAGAIKCLECHKKPSL